MIGRYMKKVFNRDEKGSEEYITSLRIALHSTVKLNVVDLVTYADIIHPAFVIPSTDDFVIGAIGHFKQDDLDVYHIYIHNLVQDNEYVLQIVEDQAKIVEIWLYQQVVSLEPETEAEYDRIMSNIGFNSIELDGIEYDRYWGSEFTEKASFRDFEETVILQDSTKVFHNSYLLYGREARTPILDKTVTELLLVGTEESEDDAIVTMMVGHKLNQTDITII